MRYFTVFAALFYCSVASSQVKTPEDIHVIEGQVGCTEKIITCESIETDAQIKDQKHWLTYLAKNLLLDSLAQDTIPRGIYSIVIFFIIDKEGCITEVKVQDDPGYGLGKKVVRVISGYNIKWHPATRNGRNVKAFKKQVVTIVVENTRCHLQEEIKELIL